MASLLAARPLSGVVSTRSTVLSVPAVGARSVRQVSSKAQQVDAQADVADIKVAQLLQEFEAEAAAAEIADVEELFADFDEDGEVAEDEEDDDEVLALGMQALKELEKDGSFLAEQVAAALLAVDADEGKQLADKAEQLLGDAVEEDLEPATVMALMDVADDAEEVQVDIEDVTPGTLRRSEEDSAIDMTNYADIQQAKLSRSELKNLVDPEWDRIKIDYVTEKKDQQIPLPEYRLNVLWLDNNIAFALDQVFSRGQVSPLSEYFFWPRGDAWEDMRATLEAKPWLSDKDRIAVLNRMTQIINFWQDPSADISQGGARRNSDHTVDIARREFPDCTFACA